MKGAACRGQLLQTLVQYESLHRVFREQQRMFQVEAFGVRAIELPVQACPGQVVANLGGPQLHDALGIDQRREWGIITGVQVAQVA